MQTVLVTFLAQRSSSSCKPPSPEQNNSRDNTHMQAPLSLTPPGTHYLPPFLWLLLWVAHMDEPQPRSLCKALEAEPWQNTGKAGGSSKGQTQGPPHNLMHAIKGKCMLYLMGSNTGFQCCSWKHSPQAAAAQKKPVNVLSFAAAPQIKLSSNPKPPLCSLLSAHLPLCSGASHWAFLGDGLITGSSARFPSVQRDGLCLPIFQMFKSEVLSRSLLGQTGSSEHTGKDRDMCRAEQKGSQWQGPKGSRSSDLLWRMKEAPQFPLRLGSRGKRPSHTLRGPKPWKSWMCTTKRQRMIWDPYTQLSACEGREEQGPTGSTTSKGQRGDVCSPLPDHKHCHSFSHFRPFSAVQSFHLSLLSQSCFPLDTPSADLTHQPPYPHLMYSPSRKLMHFLHSPKVCSILK